MQLRGPVDSKSIYDLESLASEYQLLDLVELTRTNFSADATYQSSYNVKAFTSLRMPVPSFDGNRYILHHLRCTGARSFRGSAPRCDWIQVRRRAKSDKTVEGSLNGKLPARLNAPFTLRSPHILNYLAHITLLRCVRSPTPDGSEGMVRIFLPKHEANHVLPVTNIEGIAHLIPIERNGPWLVNNRIDFHTWNNIHDGNQLSSFGLQSNPIGRSYT